MLPLLARRTKVLLGLVFLTIFGGFLLEYVLTTTPLRPFGHTQIAHIIGWIGLVCIGLTLVYPFKRWRHPNQVWPKAWFQAHMVFGVTGPALIFIHSGAHFHAWVPILAMIAMVLVVMSGITGQALHYLAFRTLYEQRHDLAGQGLSEEAIEARLHELALEEEMLRWWKCFHGPITGTFLALTLLHVGGAIYFGGW